MTIALAWDCARMRYTRLHEVPSIGERHTHENLHVEARPDLPENRFCWVRRAMDERSSLVEELAAQEPRIAAIVAKIAHLIAADQAAIFHDNGVRTYRL